MRNRTAAVLFALLGIFLFTPMFEQITNLWDVKKLNGVEMPKPMPALTLDSYSNGSFQHEVEDHLKQNFGFRAPIIRLYNQYLWDCYGKTYVSSDQVVFGKNGWLFEPWSVPDYYQQLFHYYASDSTQMASMLSDEAHRILRLQQILNSHGIQFFVCMNPAKDLLYPEHLPEDQNTRFANEPKISARFFNEEEYTRLGINHLNLEQWFLQIRDSVDYMVFPQTGMHWSRYAAIQAADTLIRYMEHLGDINMRNLHIWSKETHKATDTDDDLEKLLNLMRPMPKPNYYYANVVANDDTLATKPKMIVIGDSFWWTIAEEIPLNDIFSSVPYWYYNNTIYYDRRYHSVDEFDLAEELLSADFVVLAYCATQQYRMNNGFTQKALYALGCTAEESGLDSTAFVQLEIQRTISNIMTTPDWMGKVREQAALSDKSIEQAVRDNATWFVNNKIQQGNLQWPTKKNYEPKN